jgi:hypothetical protein
MGSGSLNERHHDKEKRGEEEGEHDVRGLHSTAVYIKRQIAKTKEERGSESGSCVRTSIGQSAVGLNYR